MAIWFLCLFPIFYVFGVEFHSTHLISFINPVYLHQQYVAILLYFYLPHDLCIICKQVYITVDTIHHVLWIYQGHYMHHHQSLQDSVTYSLHCAVLSFATVLIWWYCIKSLIHSNRLPFRPVICSSFHFSHPWGILWMAFSRSRWTHFTEVPMMAINTQWI